MAKKASLYCKLIFVFLVLLLMSASAGAQDGKASMFKVTLLEPSLQEM